MVKFTSRLKNSLAARRALTTTRPVVSGSSRKHILTNPSLDLHGSQNAPDVIFVRSSSSSAPWEQNASLEEQAKRSWSEIVVSGELKESKAKMADARVELRRRLWTVLRRAPLRCHAVGFAIAGSLFLAAILSPVGLFETKLHNLSTSVRSFVNFTTSVLTSTLQTLGFHPFATPTNHRNTTFKISLPRLPPLLVIPPPSPLSSIKQFELTTVSACCVGRNSTAFEVTSKRKGGEWIKGAATIIYVTPEREVIHERIRRLIASADDRGEASGLVRVVEVRRGPQVGVNGWGLEDSVTGASTRAPELTFYDEYLVPLKRIKVILELKMAVNGFVTGLRSLTGLGIVHRDISISNLMLDNAGMGRLIDYNHATLVMLPSDLSSNQALSGTRPFLPLNVIRAEESRLEGETLLFSFQRWHDTEALFWSIFILVLNLKDSYGCGREQYETFCSENLSAVSASKIAFRLPSMRKKLYSKYIHPHWKPPLGSKGNPVVEILEVLRKWTGLRDELAMSLDVGEDEEALRTLWDQRDAYHEILSEIAAIEV